MSAPSFILELDRPFVLVRDHDVKLGFEKVVGACRYPYAMR